MKVLSIWESANVGDVQTMRGILNSGEDPNIRDPTGKTAMAYAAMSGQIDIVTLLLERGWDTVEPGFG